MDRDDFLRLLARELYPQLRQQGFRGSGRRLRRSDSPFHHVVEVQGAGGGRACYVNLGAHVEGLPQEGGARSTPRSSTSPAAPSAPGC